MARTNDDGITLIELSVTMALFGVLATIGVYSFRNFQHSLEEQGALRIGIEPPQIEAVACRERALLLRYDR